MINYATNAICRSDLAHEPHPSPYGDCRGLPAEAAEARKIVKAILLNRHAEYTTTTDESPKPKLRVGPIIYTVLRAEIIPDYESHRVDPAGCAWPVSKVEVEIDRSLEPGEWRLSVAEGKMA